MHHAVLGVLLVGEKMQHPTTQHISSSSSHTAKTATQQVSCSEVYSYIPSISKHAYHTEPLVDLLACLLEDNACELPSLVPMS